MNFAENQTLKVSGTLKKNGQLEECIAFALKMHGSYDKVVGDTPAAQCVFKMTESTFHIGVCDMKHIPDGWGAFPFTYNMGLMAEIIRTNLDKQESQTGDSEKGFLLSRYVSDKAGDNEVGVISIKPYSVKFKVA